jgi:hypothetical protein
LSAPSTTSASSSVASRPIHICIISGHRILSSSVARPWEPGDQAPSLCGGARHPPPPLAQPIPLHPALGHGSWERRPFPHVTPPRFIRQCKGEARLPRQPTEARCTLSTLPSAVVVPRIIWCNVYSFFKSKIMQCRCNCKKS